MPENNVSIVNLPPPFDNWMTECDALRTRFQKSAETIRDLDHQPSETLPRTCVWQSEKVRLYHYNSTNTQTTPLLIVFAYVNRPDILDIAPDRSFIRRLIEQGINVYLLDWGYPDDTDQQIGLSTVCHQYMTAAVDQMRAYSRQDRVHLMGVCQGGIFALCFASLYPEKIEKLVTMVTPFDTSAREFTLARLLDYVNLPLLLPKAGNIPGQWIISALVSLKPYQLLAKKYLELANLSEDPERLRFFLQMEHWMYHCPDHPRKLFQECAEWLFQENRLLKNRLFVGRRKVKLSNIRAPVFNAYALADHIVPEAAIAQLGHFLPNTSVTPFAFDGGHIGIFVSRQAQQVIPLKIAQFLFASTPVKAV